MKKIIDLINNLFPNKIVMLILRKITHYEGGQQNSKSLRYYFNKYYNVDVGLYSYGSCFETKFNISGRVRIGKYCSIAENVRYLGANHPGHYFSTSLFFLILHSGLMFRILKEIR